MLKQGVKNIIILFVLILLQTQNVYSAEPEDRTPRPLFLCFKAFADDIKGAPPTKCWTSPYAPAVCSSRATADERHTMLALRDQQKTLWDAEGKGPFS